MNCGCPLCGTLTVQSAKGLESECVCPACGWTCRDCMGDGRGRFAPMTREAAQAYKHVKEEIEKESK